MTKRILYALCSAVLLALPWLGAPALTLLIAFVPLLILQQELADADAGQTVQVSGTGQDPKKEKGKKKSTKAAEASAPAAGRRTNSRVKPLSRTPRLWPYLTLTFALWWGATTWWVGEAAVIGAVLAVVFGTALNLTAFMIYHAVWRRAPRALAYTLLVVGWISYEYLYICGEISFPWLTLGNGFAHDVKLVQWYEYTGVLGGSLWVLICNLLVFEAWKQRRHLQSWIAPAVAVLLPVIVSLGIYYSCEEPDQKVSVEVIQPNFDPYNEKFTLDQSEQNAVMLELMSLAPHNVDFIVAPETAIDDTPWEQLVSLAPSVRQFQELIRTSYPGTTIISGATTAQRYPDYEHASATARTDGKIWYDFYNSALAIDSSSNVRIHHKSILVAGVEKMPYYNIFKHLDFLTVDLGGITGQLGVDSVRKVFTSPQGTRFGVAICYESIYGEYFTEFIRNGAQLMFVITNDGWWGDTPGYRQHFSYARLRAIETRRSIARSANTGISGFINARGDVGETLGWDVRGALTSQVSLHDRMTFYTRYGDVIGRISWYVFALGLLYFMAYRVRKRSHLND